MPETEQWRPVSGFPAYEVSDLGRVLSHRRGKPRLLRMTAAAKGYRLVKLSEAGARRTVAVHLLVAEAFHGPRPEGQEVRHLDGDPANNRLDNLRYGTRSENTYDAVRHGTHPHASKTQCRQGHAYSPTNTYVYRGKRHCRPCRAEAVTRLRQRQAVAA